MQVRISGRHMDITPAIRGHIEQGLEKLTAHFDRVIDADVVLSVEKRRHIAEINLHAHGLRINAKESSEDLYLSFDAALGKIDRQVEKHKRRIQRHQPRTSRESRSYGHHVIQIVEAEQGAGNGDGGVATAGHRVVLREQREIVPMTVNEATFQLDLIEDKILVFSNVDTDKVNVIYAHDDGTYGLIEPLT